MEREQRSHCSVCGLVPLLPGVRGATHVVAKSPAMQQLLTRVARFADSEAAVAITGETGTGKEVIARLLHANSPRSAGPFVPVNLAALPAELLEAELFGHAKGAYTGATAPRRGLFEAAHGGTLFLDEIAEMPAALQAKLLRVLQDGEVRRLGETAAFMVDVRIVCATHRDLAAGVRSGEFREDLYYRLKVLALEVPPLRARREDVLPLAHRFLSAEKRRLLGFSSEAEAQLLAHDWPGNVRELENAVKHGAALALGERVETYDLPEELMPASRRGRDSTVRRLKTLAEVEREHIERVLEACNGCQTEAANVLGVARNTLWRKVRRR